MDAQQSKLLVTTALEETWGSDEPIVFLGEWCKLYDRREIWSNRDYTVVPYHWDDRTKLKNDYEYLKGLYESLLEDLCRALNEYHQIERPLRYWRIILAPWLISYVAVIFDRWECIRVAFENEGHLKTNKIPSSLYDKIPFGSSGFLNASNEDDWNHFLFLDIIHYNNFSTCCIEEQQRIISSNPKPFVSSIDNTSKKSPFKILVNFIDDLLCKLSLRNSVMFYTSYFPPFPLLKLHLKLRQIPCMYFYVFEQTDDYVPLYDIILSRSLKLSLIGDNAFEKYLLQRIVRDIPYAYVEGYSAMVNKTNTIHFKPKAIFTANAHWNNEVFKFFCAEQVYTRGVKYITMEHGGAIPPQCASMCFQEDTADATTTWSVPHHPKHVQLPANKLVHFQKRSSKEYCAVVCVEFPRYLRMASSSPHSSQTLVHVNQAIDFYKSLNHTIQNFFKLRPYLHNDGWNTKQRFIDNLGVDKVHSDGTLYEFYSSARVIICTYPQTTFSEAMCSGLPTILLYPEHLWETRPEFDSLLDILKRAKIVFVDPKSAADHVNAIWDNPDQWWNSSEVLAAREVFHQMACRNDSNWLEQWTAFVKEVIEK